MTLRRLTPAQWRFYGGMAILIGCACAPATSGPTPRPTPLNYSGNWSGRTAQGGAITFTISSDQRITALAVDFNFAGCSGTVTIAPNSIVFTTAGFADALVVNTPNGPSGPSRTVTQLSFPTAATANGTLDFIDFPTCGTSTTTWTASKRS